MSQFIVDEMPLSGKCYVLSFFTLVEQPTICSPFVSARPDNEEQSPSIGPLCTVTKGPNIVQLGEKGGQLTQRQPWNWPSLHTVKTCETVKVKKTYHHHGQTNIQSASIQRASQSNPPFTIFHPHSIHPLSPRCLLLHIIPTSTCPMPYHPK